jgi:hypothetical protein
VHDEPPFESQTLYSEYKKNHARRKSFSPPNKQMGGMPILRTFARWANMLCMADEKNPKEEPRVYPHQGKADVPFRYSESFSQTEAYQRLATEIEHLVELVRESQFHQHEFMTKSYELLREYARDVEQVQADVRNFLENARFLGVRSEEVEKILEKLDTIIGKLGAQETAGSSPETITYSDVLGWTQGHGGFLGCKEFVADRPLLDQESASQRENTSFLARSASQRESRTGVTGESASNPGETQDFHYESLSRLSRESSPHRESPPKL